MESPYGFPMEARVKMEILMDTNKDFYNIMTTHYHVSDVTEAKKGKYKTVHHKHQE